MGSAQVICAQQTAESDAEVRQQLIKETIALRDSVALMLTYVQAKNPQVSKAFKAAYNRAAQNLRQYKSQLDKSLDELIQSVDWYQNTESRNRKILTEVSKNLIITKRELDVLEYP